MGAAAWLGLTPVSFGGASPADAAKRSQVKTKLSSFQQLSAQYLTRRVTILLAVVILGGFGLLLGADLSISRQQEYDAVLRDSDNLSRVLEREVASVVEKIDVVLAENAHQYGPLVNDGKTRGLLDANLDLQRWMGFIPEAQKESLRVVNPQGRVVYNAGTSEALPDVVVADRVYFQHQKDDPQAGLVLSEPLLSRFTGKWLITLSRRMNKADGSFGGVVQTALRTEYFQSLFEGLDVGQSGNVSLFDTDMRLLSRLPALPEQLGKAFDNTDVRGGLAAGFITGNYETVSRVDGVRRLFLYRKLEGLPYVVVIGRAPDEFLSSWRRKAVLYALSYAALALAMVVALRVFHRQNEHSRRLISQVFEASREGMVVTDADGLIITVNEAFSRITGHPLAEAVGKTNAILKSGRHDEAFYAEMWRALVMTGEWRGEVWNKRRNGELYPELLSINALRDAQGKTSHYIGIFSDITELYETRRQAEAANKAKGEFLATMSHEIRTPMNGIIGMTGLLLDTRLTTDQRHFAETIRISSESLLSIINDILDFSRIEAGRLELESYSFDVSSMIEGVADLLAPRVVGKQLEMSVYVDPELQGEFVGDPGRIRQVVMNLVGNAVKFTEKGSVSINASRLMTPDGAEHLRVTVDDTGVGIPDEAKSRLFGEFTQADASTARRFGGSGLGLAICRGIVAMMGGKIGFDSTVGKGSSFWFTIPLKRLALSPMEAPAPLSGLRVLVVDDTPANVEVFTRQLQGWGAEVVSAPLALDALALMRGARAQGKDFDLAILDHHMPGMTGVDLAGIVKGDPSLHGLKLILASSALHEDVRRQADQLGFEAVLIKPIRPSALLDCLMTGLGLSGAGSVLSDVQSDAAQVQPQGRPLRILVAEDNAINQQVATGLLARLGHRADVASDGGEAVVLVERGDYDLVLMDVQMPEMDGIAATRAIRAMNGAKAGVPIVAMTANAMAGDRENFLQAGMDDYISKPISRRSLQAMLERWSDRLNAGAAATAAEAENAAPEAAADLSALVDEGVRREMTEELGAERYGALVGRLMADLPGILETMRGLLEQGDVLALGRAAHSLKGSAGNLGFSGLFEAARQLDQATRDHEENLVPYFKRLADVAEASKSVL